MRPLTLEVEGFTAYRDPVEVDFTDADYFVLVGPTGSGKSSIIDAMTFALYGAIPRLDLRSVEPIIAKGKAEARVRLDFALGEQRFTAVRVVRRQGTGASTKEARLERGDEVLAGDAEGVTTAVEGLLGLTFEEFTRCVVLPQGEFARFMHDKPRARQDLLVRLLDLQVYERVQQRANARASTADAELTIQKRRLEEDLSFATEEALTQMRQRITALEALRDRIEADEPRLQELRETVREAREEADGARRAAAALSAIVVPPDLDELAAGMAQARTSHEAAAAALADAEQARSAAEEALAAAPARGPLQIALDAHERLEKAKDDLTTAEAARTGLATAATAARTAADEAAAALTSATDALEHARVAHRAADLARTLAAGEPCPVCGQHVHEIPALDVPPDLEAADAAVAAAKAAAKGADDARGKAEKILAAAEARSQTIRETIAGLEAAVAAHPDRAAVVAALKESDAAETGLSAARTAESQARSAEKTARDAVDRAVAAQKHAWTALEAARDTVAEHGPPALERDDVAADWATLAGWATERAALMTTAAEKAQQRAADAERAGLELAQAHKDACATAGLTDVTSPRDDCLKALQSAIDARERIEEALERVQQVRAEIDALSQRVAVAKSLGNHLRANAFERWVLSQALTALTQGATQILLELSGGQYSLDLDQHYNFAVIDHRNADAKRSAKTLSGGETFLASLALALAMSDRIATLSANSAVRLESIFLDEGFGALDPETLEVVRAAIENLSARRTVGIVTHVRELAEEIPVRFEVRKGPHTSTIERVLA